MGSQRKKLSKNLPRESYMSSLRANTISQETIVLVVTKVLSMKGVDSNGMFPFQNECY